MKTINLKTVSRLTVIKTIMCLFTLNASASDIFDSKVTCENKKMKIVVSANLESAKVFYVNGQTATYKVFLRNLTGGSNFQIVILHISDLNDFDEDLIINDRFKLAKGTTGTFNKAAGYGSVTTARFHCKY